MAILISISAMLLGFWIIWRLVNIHPQPQEKPYNQMSDRELVDASRARGIILPKDFVGPSYRSQHPHFWPEDEP